MPTRTIGSRRVSLSSLDKIYFPDCGLTKGDVIDYYARIADRMLPHLEGRPLTLQRYPDGLDGEGFFQKQIGEHFPDWIDRVEVVNRGGGGRETTTYAVCRDAATLVWLANQGCLTPHIWLSRCEDLEHPDQMVFDLDPAGDTADPGVLRDAALWLRDRLAGAGLEPFLKTSGSRGYHLHVPLPGNDNFEKVRRAAREHAEAVASDHPETLTTAQRKAKRGGRLFLDINRNAFGQTTVCPYAIRARPGAPVATPIAWHQLEREAVDPRRYHVRNLFRRLGQMEDPWSGFPDHSAGDR